MNVESIINECAKQDVQLSVVDEQLEVYFDQHPSDELIDLLRENKSQLLQYFDQHSSQQASQPIFPHREFTAPLSFQQKRLWFIDRLEQDSAQYNIPMALKMSGKVDADNVERALKAVVQRHWILRTTYSEDGTTQHVRDPFDFELVRTDLRSVSGEKQQTQLTDLTDAFATQPFDLTKDLMLRAGLIQLQDTQWVLLLTVHHIACDGASLATLLNEFGYHYAACSSEEITALEPLEIQYSDYAIWLTEDKERFHQELTYWTAQLADLPTTHGLPLDFTRPKEQDFNGSQVSRELGVDVSEHLRVLARKLDVTPFMLLHSAFSLLLSRWSGNQDIVIGTPASGKEKTQLAPLIGFFTNTLVLRSQVEAQQSFEQLVTANKTTMLEALNHQQLPFDMLVERLQPERSLNQSPLFQIMLSYHSQSKAEFEIADIDVSALPQRQSMSKFDLELSIEEENQNFVFNWQYATSLFSASSVERLASSFEYLLAQLVHRTDRPVSSYDIVPETDAVKLKHWLAHPSTKPTPELNLLERFASQAELTPQDIAVRFGDETLTYAQLNQASGVLATSLLAKGVSVGDIVAISLPRGTELIVGLLGILKAGAAYLPIEPEIPQTRQQMMLADSSAKLVLTQQDIKTHLASGGDQDLTLPTVSSEDLAYVIYTSGSTGRPKGVKVTHGNVQHLLSAMDYLLKSGGKWLAVTGVNFDISVFEIFGALTRGFELVVAPELKLTQDSVAKMVYDHQITHLQCTPSFAQLHLLAADTRASLQSLKTIMVAGEAFTKNLEEGLTKNTSAQVYNLYGPTEGTIFTTCHPLDGRFDRIPIGKPLSGYDCYVLDSGKNLLPIGAIGELFIGGPGVTAGYLNNEALTKEKFVELPAYSQQPLYATGDMVRWLEDGNIEFVGRRDNQVKLRGHRIEIGEIEHALMAQPGVKNGAVVIHEFSATDKRLVAYVQFEDGDEDSLQDKLKVALAALLPSYMVPAVWVPMDALPLTLTGKLDRKSLPVPTLTVTSNNTELTTSTEVQVAQLWCAQLKLDQQNLGKESNFFGLGGHSLLLAELINRVSDRFGVTLTIREVFELSTLSDLAARIDQKLQDSKAAEEQQTAAKTITSNRFVEAPLSYAQQRLWFIDQLQGSSVEYNMPAAYRIEGAFDPDIAQSAITQIIERHGILRTLYREDEQGNARQIIQDSFDFHLERHDLSGMESAEQQHQLDTLLQNDLNAPFNLSADLMVRASFILLSGDVESLTGVFTINMHHIASDGWSIAKFVNEFIELYEGKTSATEPSLPELPVQYADFAVWQRKMLDDEQVQGLLDFWEEKLVDVPQVHSLPLDHPRPEKQSYAGRVHYQLLDSATLYRLNSLATSHKASLFMVIQSLYALALSKWSQQKDVVVGTPIAGRNQPELENLVGCFLNTLMLRNKIDDNTSYSQYLANIRSNTLDVFQHQDIPFELLVEKLNPSRDLAYNPLIQIWFVMHNQEQKLIELPDFSISTIREESVTTQFDLELSATVLTNRPEPELILGWTFSTSLFDADTVELLSQYFASLIDEVTQDPDIGLGNITPPAIAEQKSQNTLSTLKKRQFGNRFAKQEQ